MSANARAGRLDEEIAAKEEFKKQQGVLAQQFFTQKLRLRATQEKEWTKFKGYFMCPCYKTEMRGPTIVFSAQVKTRSPAARWVMGGVAIIFEVS